VYVCMCSGVCVCVCVRACCRYKPQPSNKSEGGGGVQVVLYLRMHIFIPVVEDSIYTSIIHRNRIAESYVVAVRITFRILDNTGSIVGRQFSVNMESA
jgi:hypothetical protein